MSGSVVPTDRDFEMVARAVTAGTRQNYKAAPALWEEFILTPDSEISPGDLFLQEIDHESHSILINRFLSWMIEGRGGDTPAPLKASVACKVLTGLRFLFTTHHRSTAVFDSDQVRKAKTQALLHDRHVPYVDRPLGLGPLPFTIELLESLRGSHWSGPHASLESKMVYISLATGTCFGLRPGEAVYVGPYVGDPNHPKAKAQDHRYLWRDIQFEVVDHVDGLYSFESYIEAPLPKPSIDLITWVKDTSKTSRGQKDGLQHYMCRGNQLETQFFEDFMSWVVICGCTCGDQMVFSKFDCVSRDPSKVTYKLCTGKMYTTAMKGVAALHGLPQSCFMGKSPRIYVVTNTSMAGRSSVHTRAITGHSSESGPVPYLHRIAGSATAARMEAIPCGATTTSFADPNMMPLATLKRSVALGTGTSSGRPKRSGDGRL
jgi:hypothetical protein